MIQLSDIAKRLLLENRIRPGVDFVFKENPELSEIGTPEQYSEYLDTIFPNSKIKDIVYQGSKNGQSKFEKFDNFDLRDKVSFLSSNKNHAAAFGKVLCAVVNITNPFRDTKIRNGVKFDEFLNDSAGEWTLNRSISEDKDGIVSKNIPDAGFIIDEYVVFKPEQIHILGSKQDIEGFKKFVENL